MRKRVDYAAKIAFVWVMSKGGEGEYAGEGVAEPPLVKAPRIGYFGRIGDFSRFVRIFDSQDVENRLYNKKTAKIGLFRPIFVCFYAISGY